MRIFVRRTQCSDIYAYHYLYTNIQLYIYVCIYTYTYMYVYLYTHTFFFVRRTQCICVLAVNFYCTFTNFQKLGYILHLSLFGFFFFFLHFWATPEAYGAFQAKGQIGAVAAVLHHSHSNMGSKPCLQPKPQLTAMPDP